MNSLHQLGAGGAVLLTLCLVGYLIYELVLYPAAGFPTFDFAVIVAGADTLRVGHILKFGYAFSLAMLMSSLQIRLREAAPVLALPAQLAGTGAIILFLASGWLGLRILAVAEATFTTHPDEASATIFLRTVTISLFEAAGFAVGWYALLVSGAGLLHRVLPRPLSLLGVLLGVLYIVDVFLPDPLRLLAPLASIGWTVWLAVILLREATHPAWPGPAHRRINL
jgi:hypothetical protein